MATDTLASSPDAPGTPKSWLWAGRAMTALFVLFMVFDTAIKLLRLQIVDDTLIALGYPVGIGFAIGVLEAILLALYLIPRTSLLGAVLFTGLLRGAIASHLRADSPLFRHVLFPVYSRLFAWPDMGLRHAPLHALFPIR